MKRLMVAALFLVSCGAKKERYVNAADKRFDRQGAIALLDGQPFSGVSFSLYANGDTATSVDFLNGRQEGRSTEYFSHSRPKRSEYYMNGRACGPRSEWFENGQLKLDAQLFNDQYEGRVREWFPSGVLFRDGFYRNGQEGGLQRMYWADGNLRANYRAVDGRKYGLTGVKNCGATGAVLPYYNTADLTPAWEAGTVSEAHVIAPFRFQAQDGKATDNKLLKGHIYVANFFFTSCSGICLKMMKNLHAVADTFNREKAVRFVSFTVDPGRDSRTRLAAYASQNGIAARQWHLLTGDKGSIYSLARQSYYAEGTDGIRRKPDEFLHTEHCFLVDGKGRIRGVYNGTVAMEMDRMVADIRLLMGE